jgi:demethylmenaquinone methyltransferase / 2-methoxy-6-polyprenyl-1,4-benzoquinol methylase
MTGGVRGASVLPTPDAKPAYVRQMFDTIAGGYDPINRLMTFGLDQGWRRMAARLVVAPLVGQKCPARVLDVGTGTGDFLAITRAESPDALVVGVDFSLPMMRVGVHHSGATLDAGGFVGGDALRLPFGDDTFDAITTGFAMRNVGDLPLALREMRRVARPGARMACLEVARPRWALLRLGHRLYFHYVVPRVAGWLSGHRDAYTYLPQSAEHFPAPDHLCQMLRDAGWHEPRYRLLGLGAVAIHIAEK